MPPPVTVKIWDPLIRLLHWGLAAACIANLSVLREADEPHRWIGYFAVGGVVIRMTWGWIGSHHARFADFVPGPARLVTHLVQLAARREPRYLGHNPAGAVMMLTLLGLVGTLGVTGWMMGTDRFWGETWVENIHQSAANILIACLCVHVAGAIAESVRHRENLILAMITGRKRAPGKTDIVHAPAADRG